MAAYGAPGIWTRRLAMTIQNGGAAASGDCDVVIPPDLDDFWNTIDSSGLELRAVSWDSRTKLNYSVDNGSGGAFDKTNRLGRIRIDGATLVADACIVLLWLYYGSSSAQGTGAVATTMTAPLTGTIETATPSIRRYRYEPVSPNLTRPRTVLPAKRAQEACYVWVDMTKALSRRITPAGGAYLHEEVMSATMDVVNSSSVSQPTMFDVTKNRFVYNQSTGQTWLRLYVTAGVSGSNYTIVPQVKTNFPDVASFAQALTPLAALPVRDLVFTS